MLFVKIVLVACHFLMIFQSLLVRVIPNLLWLKAYYKKQKAVLRIFSFLEQAFKSALSVINWIYLSWSEKFLKTKASGYDRDYFTSLALTPAYAGYIIYSL